MNRKEVCATKIAYVRMTEEDLADLDCQVRRVGAASRSAYIRGLVKDSPCCGTTCRLHGFDE